MTGARPFRPDPKSIPTKSSVSVDGRWAAPIDTLRTRVQRRVEPHPLTQRNLLNALGQEALSSVRLLAYGSRAEAEGDVTAARMFRQLASVDAEHARAILDLLGWVSDLRDNALAQLVGDDTAHGLEYPRYARDARRAGDATAAALFERLARDETEAALVLLALLGRRQLAVPEEPSHETLRTQSAPEPRPTAHFAQSRGDPPERPVGRG